jgi:hypothetical protein
MTRQTRPLTTLLIAGSALVLGVWPMAALASTAPGLGKATSFAVLAGATVTNTGLTVITGDLGVSPGTAVTGMTGPPNGTLHGTQYTGTDAQAISAKRDLNIAYGVAASSPCNFNETGKNLGGQTLTPGTYCQTTAPTLTGTVTLNGNGVYIFQIGSTLVTGPGATVSLIEGAQPCNVFWQVSSSATLDTTTTFVGTIMALTSISLNDGATIRGRALAQTGSVTLIHNQITAPTSCNETTVPGPTATATPSASPTASPASSPAASPTPSAVRLPSTGGGPQNGVPWMLMLIAGIGAVGLGLRIRARRQV